jgi:hypothetical protein
MAVETDEKCCSSMKLENPHLVALRNERATSKQSSGEARRENADSWICHCSNDGVRGLKFAVKCLDAVVLAKARTHTAEFIHGVRWQTTFAKTTAWS